MSKIADAIARKKTQLPQFEYLWRVELPSLGSTGGDMSVDQPISMYELYGPEYDGLILPPATQTSSVDMEEMSHRVTSFDAPMPTIETAKNTAGSSFVYTAANNDIGSVSMRIDEMEDGLTLAYLTQWQSMITRDDGFYNVPSFYKRDLKIIRMSSTELDLHVSTYHGYFPTEIAPIGYNYDSNGILQYNVTFTGDSVSHKIIPAEQVKSMIQAEQSKIMTADSPTGIDIGSLSRILGAAGSVINSNTLAKIIQVGSKVKNFF